MEEFDITLINTNKSLKSMNGEIWKEIKDYEGIYQVSNFGRVKRMAAIVKSVSRWGDAMLVTWKERIHKHHIDKMGRPRIELSKQGFQKIFTVSRLVAFAYVHNPYNLPIVCHRDDNPLNNVDSNLFWGTHQDNVEDKCKKDRQAKGEKHGMAYLNAKQVIKIRNEFNNKGKYCINRLVKEYSTTRQNIVHIISRKTWKHIP